VFYIPLGPTFSVKRLKAACISWLYGVPLMECIEVNGVSLCVCVSGVIVFRWVRLIRFCELFMTLIIFWMSAVFTFIIIIIIIIINLRK
jgi:hypothetical protein